MIGIRLAALALPFCVACAGSPQAEHSRAEQTPSRSAAPSADIKLETVVSGVEVPWAIAFLPDRRMIFTERPGRVRIVEGGKLRLEPLLKVEDAIARSESGLMGLCLHPDFAKNRFVYIAYSSGRDRGDVKVERYTLNGYRLESPKLILGGIPAAPNHAGCRIKFGPDRKLYITAGDATDRRIAQQMDSLGGKFLRVNDDGTIPSDNPFVGQAGARGEIWAVGSRNAQGIDWQPGTNLLFATEHGPSGFDGPGGGDEVNIIEKGKNYGWPTIHHKDSREGLVSPLLEYTPAVAPASGAFYRGKALKGFTGNFFFGCLVGNALIRVELDGRRVVSQERMFTNLGRIREVAEGPDGYLYFSTSNRDGRGRPAAEDDRIFRIVPAP